MPLQDFTASIFSFVITLLLILLLKYLFREKMFFSKDKIIQQLVILIILVIGMGIVVLTLPLSTEDKNIILTLTGIVIGATITFSSTTFVANAMAGIMLRMISPFRKGDFIKINDTFGRVTEINFLHTQIQSIDRDLVMIPNQKLISDPLKTIRSSGTIITTSVSLGYDISRKSIEKNLLLAAENTGLESPFVHVTNLGDFSVTYKVGGLLKDLESLITKRSDFKKNVMDSLHGADIEIVSPTFMNQRVFGQDYVCIPPEEKDETPSQPDVTVPKTEDIIFDKAIEARNLDAIYTNWDHFTERKKSLEGKLKELKDEKTIEQVKLELLSLLKQEEELKPSLEILRNSADIQTDMDDKERERILNLIVDLEAKELVIDENYRKLENRVERLLKRHT
ncbi:mechanosensitive ion channel domain-containing protein [Methanolobus sp.]|uniref:mechanosensitive ion channel family protein n=1 Tax=Methanolobus sp. TaxID=1874737 RepID=UPI0025F66EBD|nr:mechanosensitive ion channel domain-containing protein [Methanolobus sp.]